MTNDDGYGKLFNHLASGKRKRAKEKADDRLPPTTCSPSSDTPENDKFTAACNGMDDASHLVALDKFARKLECERDNWRNEHDRVVREYQHRLTVLATSAIEATHYPENA